MSPDYERGNVRLYRGDCLGILPMLAEREIDVIIMDPVWPNAHPDLLGSDDPDGLFHRFCTVAPAAKCWLVWLGCQSDPRFLRHVPSDKPFLRCCYMRRAVPSYNGRCLVGGDVVYAFGEWPPSVPGRRVLPGEVSVTSNHRNRVNHPAARNQAHCNWLVKFWTDLGDIVLDPFVGSGTTGVACVNFGRPFVGIELDPQYFEIACKRIDSAFEAGALFADLPETKEDPTLPAQAEMEFPDAI